MMAGVNMVNVPYRGGYVPDLLGGQTQVVFGTIASCIPLISAGKLRALAVTTAMRSTALPDVPVMGESVPGYEASQWYGLGAPRNTPAEVIDKLNKEINAVAADPNMKARFDGLGVDPMSMTSAELREIHCRRNREVGQGDQGRQHQGGIDRSACRGFSYKLRSATAPGPPIPTN